MELSEKNIQEDREKGLKEKPGDEWKRQGVIDVNFSIEFWWNIIETQQIILKQIGGESDGKIIECTFPELSKIKSDNLVNEDLDVVVEFIKSRVGLI